MDFPVFFFRKITRKSLIPSQPGKGLIQTDMDGGHHLHRPGWVDAFSLDHQRLSAGKGKQPTVGSLTQTTQQLLTQKHVFGLLTQETWDFSHQTRGIEPARH